MSNSNDGAKKVNGSIIFIGANMSYPYPYKGSIVLHLNDTEQKQIQKIISEEIDEKEKSLRMWSENQEWWCKDLFPKSDMKIYKLELKSLNRLREMLKDKDPRIIAEAFKYLVIVIDRRMRAKRTVSQSVQGIIADGIKAYNNMENATDSEIKSWIGNNLMYIAEELNKEMSKLEPIEIL